MNASLFMVSDGMLDTSGFIKMRFIKRNNCKTGIVKSRNSLAIKYFITLNALKLSTYDNTCWTLLTLELLLLRRLFRPSPAFHAVLPPCDFGTGGESL